MPEPPKRWPAELCQGGRHAGPDRDHVDRAERDAERQLEQPLSFAEVDAVAVHRAPPIASGWT